MIDTLSFIDKEATLFVNGFHNAFFDIFFYLGTSSLVWIPLYLMLLWLVFKRQGMLGIVTVLFIGLVVLLADQLSSSLIKHLVERPRPSRDAVMQFLVHTVNGYRGGAYGFVSSHAANCFGVATFIGLVMRNKALTFSLMVWALLNVYSRVYLGVHYLGDILCGGLLGVVIAFVVYEFYLHASLHFFVINHHNKWTLKSGLAQMFGVDEPVIVALTFWVTVALLSVISYMMLSYHGIIG